MCPCVSQHSKFSIPGETALAEFPHLQQDVERVASERSFMVTDVSWIAEILGCMIRVTIDPDTFQNIINVGNDQHVDQDALYGCNGGDTDVHLHFQYQQTAGDSGRQVGHFDVLQPTSQRLFCKMLPADVPWAGVKRQHSETLCCLYLYIYIYVI